MTTKTLERNFNRQEAHFYTHRMSFILFNKEDVAEPIYEQQTRHIKQQENTVYFITVFYTNFSAQNRGQRAAEPFK